MVDGLDDKHVKATRDEVRAMLLLGPTACGKSALAMRLAQRLPIEIISVDSALVYRGMDIGTAKPTREERAQVPHHLIDIRDPEDTYSAAQFCADAERTIDEVRARGRFPLLVGGTMLYARALLAPMDDLPRADPTTRARIDEMAAVHGWPGVHAELGRHDPITAARLKPTDAQRIQRAMEIWMLTGRPMSSLLTGPARIAPRVDIPLIALEPGDRARLHGDIAARFRAMLDGGFLNEVRALRGRRELSAELPSMRAVGYRQAWQYLDAMESEGLESSAAARAALESAFIEAGLAATRQLAKRQLTWLRSLPARWRVDSQQVDCDETLFLLIEGSLG